MICVDASVAAKWVLPEDLSDKARSLAIAAERSGEAMVAPALLPFEVANILRQRLVRAAAGERLTLAQAQQALALFLAVPVALSTPATLYEQALAIADTYGLPGAYDAHYVGLAQMLGCDFWTDDRRLLRALAGRLPFVRWIGDFSG